MFRPNGVPCYVGKGTGERYRLMSRRHNKHLARIIQAAGGRITSIRMAIGLTEAEALELERRLIAVFGRERYGGILVNDTDGGDGVSGLVHSPESKARMSGGRIWKRSLPVGYKHSEEVKAKMRRPHLSVRGRKPSLETIEKIAASKRGRERPAEVWAKIRRPKGWKHTEEARAKIAAASLGRKASDETRAKMRASWIIRKNKSAT